MYTGLHLNVSWKSHSFKFFDLSSDMKLAPFVEGSIFIAKHKTFDCGI